MLSILGYDGATITPLEPSAIAGWLNQAGAKLWLDVQSPTTEETIWVRQVFSLPHIRGEGWPDAAASLHPTPRFITGHLPIHLNHSLDFCLGHSFLLTIHSNELPLLTQLWLIYQQDLSRWPYGLDSLLYQLLQSFTVVPLTDQQSWRDKWQQLPTMSASTPLLQEVYQLQTWQHYLQQWHTLTGQLAQLHHEYLDANMAHQFHLLQQQIQAQQEEITLLQNGLTLYQQQWQMTQTDRTHLYLRLGLVLMGVGLLLFLLFAFLLFRP